MNRIFDGVFAARSRDEWMEIFQAHGLMFCSVQHIQEVVTDEQALANGYLTAFDHPVQGPVTLPGYPVHFSACNAGTWKAAPKLGEHTDEVLHQMGLSNADIESLRSAGIIK